LEKDTWAFWLELSKWIYTIFPFTGLKDNQLDPLDGSDARLKAEAYVAS